MQQRTSILVIEEIIYLIPITEFILLLVLCLWSIDYIESSNNGGVFGSFKTISIFSVVFSVINFIIGISLSFKTGICGCTRMIETKTTLIARVFNEIIMAGACIYVFYLASVCYDNNDIEFYKFIFIFYLLADLLYIAATLTNLVIIIMHFRDYLTRPGFDVLQTT